MFFDTVVMIDMIHISDCSNMLISTASKCKRLMTFTLEVPLRVAIVLKIAARKGYK